jgi:preprotein translocase subunit SecA
MATLTVRLPDVLKGKVQACADELGLSLNAIVVVALDAYLRGRTSEPESSPPVVAKKPKSPIPKVGRNDPCPCGSGKKYKRCHGA